MRKCSFGGPINSKILAHPKNPETGEVWTEYGKRESSGERSFLGCIMRTRIVRVGNSQGVRIPKRLLEQSGIKEDVELEIENGGIIIRAVHTSRVAAHSSTAEHGDDVLPESGSFHDEIVSGLTETRGTLEADDPFESLP